MTWATVYKWSVRISQFAAKFSFVAAALYGLYQWRESKIDGRVKETMALYDKYNSPPFTTYRESLGILIAKNGDALVAASQKGDATGYSQILLDAMKATDSSNGLDVLSDLFDGISECVSARLCDRDVVARLFQPRAESLYNQFYPYIEHNRKDNGVTAYAIGIQNLRTLTQEEPSWGRFWRGFFL